MALKLRIDETLINSLIDAAEKGFQLGEKQLQCIAVGTTFSGQMREVTGIVGVAGRVNGTIMVNMTAPVALRLASAMLMDEFAQVDKDVLDAIAECANVIGGRLKSSLANSGYPFDHITLPSVILGQNYFISHSRGMSVVHASFEVDDDVLPMQSDRVVHVIMTLLTNDLKRNEPS